MKTLLVLLILSSSVHAQDLSSKFTDFIDGSCDTTHLLAPLNSSREDVRLSLFEHYMFKIRTDSDTTELYTTADDSLIVAVVYSSKSGLSTSVACFLKCEHMHEAESKSGTLHSIMSKKYKESKTVRSYVRRCRGLTYISSVSAIRLNGYPHLFLMITKYD